MVDDAPALRRHRVRGVEPLLAGMAVFVAMMASIILTNLATFLLSVAVWLLVNVALVFFVRDDLEMRGASPVWAVAAVLSGVGLPVWLVWRSMHPVVRGGRPQP